MRSELVTGFKYAGEKAVCLHAPNLPSAIDKPLYAWVGFFSAAREVIDIPSFEVAGAGV
jgi:hypothetical protein